MCYCTEFLPEGRRTSRRRDLHKLRLLFQVLRLLKVRSTTCRITIGIKSDLATPRISPEKLFPGEEFGAIKFDLESSSSSTKEEWRIEVELGSQGPQQLNSLKKTAPRNSAYRDFLFNKTYVLCGAVGATSATIL